MTIEEALEIVERSLQQGRLNKVQEIVLRQAWEGKSYMAIARTFGYDAGYLKDIGSKLWQQLSDTLGEKVTKLNLQAVLKRSVRKLEIPGCLSLQTDWGEAIDVSQFYGRAQELDTLQQWIRDGRCRLVTLLGMGGLGKTALSVKLGEQVQGQFAGLIWRSLRDAPTIDELLITLIPFLSRQQEMQLPETTGGKLSRLIELLRQSRSLIILDNFDAVLQSGARAGTYRAGYESYGELLRRVGEIAHPSCLVLTSREKPQEVAALEGDQLPVRTLLLSGVDGATGREILRVKGLEGEAENLIRLVNYYGGNPLALKIAATSIRDLFGGDVGQFLTQGTAAFNGISILLGQQYDRVSSLEQQVLDWLAINREPVSSSEIQADLIAELSRLKLMEVLESLRSRSLIESSAAGFTLQPVVMEYLTERLIDRFSQEILAEEPRQFLSHALMKAQAKDYIRESQVRVIVQPLVDRLLGQLGSPKQVEHKLDRLLLQLRQEAHTCGYGGGNLLNLLRQLETNISGYDFSGLSIRQAYLQDVCLHRVNFAEASFVDCAFAANFGGLASVNISPDGQRLATSDTNGGIQIWDLQGQQLGTCEGHNSWVWRAIFSPCQLLLASCGQDHTVRLWEADTGTCRQVLAGHTGIVTSIAFSPDGQLLLSTSGDQTIRIWNVATGREIQTLRGHGACVWSAVFHPDGKTLWSAGEDSLIRVWNPTSGECLRTLTGHQHWIKAIDLSPDGTTLASASWDQTLKLWDTETGDCLATLRGHHKTVTSVAFSPDGQILASSSYDHTVKLWSVDDRQCFRTLQKHTNAIWSVAFHPDGHLLVSGGEDHTARLWDIYTGQCIHTIQGHSNAIYSIALNAANRLLASAHEDQTIKLWNFDGETLHSDAIDQPFRTLRGHRGRIFSLSFSPDRSILASGSADRTIKLWNFHTGQCLHTLQGHTSWVWAIAISPDGRTIASGSYDHTSRLWNIETGECLQLLEGHSSSIVAIAYSPSGKWIASGGYEQTIKLWDAQTGECRCTWHAHLNRVWALAFSPDGAWLATGGDDNTIALWELATGQSHIFQGHTSQVLSILFSADSATLISSSADKTIKRWDIATGVCIATLEGHQNWVWSLVLLDEATLLSGSQDETIAAWNLETGKSLKTLQPFRPYEQSNITAVRELTKAQEAMLLALGCNQFTSPEQSD
ncbi:MAG TPA: NB-ARC domain-containing protein [Thermosynechococcaceae cyanobacterium]